MKVTILGCGASSGTPAPGLAPGKEWGRADPQNPRNRRSRSSLLLEQDGFSLLVDATPDLREQMLRSQIHHLDAVLFTHPHADHCHGLDDLRPLIRRLGHPLPAWMDPKTLSALTTSFAYAFPSGAVAPYQPLFLEHVLEEKSSIGPFSLQTFAQDHGTMESLGFRIGSFAYTTDVVHLSPKAFGILEGVEFWVLGALRDRPHPCHIHLEKALSWAKKIQPKQTILTHMSHEVDYADWCKRCPKGVEPGYDGMVLQI